MIIGDTNVVSEFMKPRPNSRVLEWQDALDTDSFHVTAITVGELLYGAARTPAGKRKDELDEKIQRMLSSTLPGRVLPFGHRAAERYAEIRATLEKMGRPISEADYRIAATVRSYGAVLATRNVTHFEHCGIEVINPWEEG